MKMLAFIFRPAIFGTLLAAYIALLMMPATWWYQPNALVVAQVQPGEAPMVTIDRTIHRSFLGTYTSDVRQFPSGVIACGQAGAHRYQGGQTGIGAPMTLAQWAGGDDGCNQLEGGIYTVETCWTISAPFLGLLPPKTTCIKSNPFKVTP